MPERTYFDGIDVKQGNTTLTSVDVEDSEARQQLSDLEDYVGTITPVPLIATENKTYTAPTGVFGYSPVTVNVGTPQLPTGYTQLDYVTCGGETSPAYCEISLSLNDNVDIWEFITSTNTIESGYHTFFARINQYSLAYNGSTLKGWQVSPFTGDVTATVGTVYRTNISTSGGSGNITYTIGAYRSDAEYFDGRIYSIKCKHSDSDGEKSLFDTQNMALFLVPAKRNSDDKVGLYDVVSDTFYTSTSGNDFGEPIKG